MADGSAVLRLRSRGSGVVWERATRARALDGVERWRRCRLRSPRPRRVRRVREARGIPRRDGRRVGRRRDGARVVPCARRSRASPSPSLTSRARVLCSSWRSSACGARSSPSRISREPRTAVRVAAARAPVHHRDRNPKPRASRVEAHPPTPTPTSATASSTGGKSQTTPISSRVCVPRATTRSVLDERSPPHPSLPYSSSERFGPSNDSNRSSRTNHARRAATLAPARRPGKRSPSSTATSAFEATAGACSERWCVPSASLAQTRPSPIGRTIRRRAKVPTPPSPRVSTVSRPDPHRPTPTRRASIRLWASRTSSDKT